MKLKINKLNTGLEAAEEKVSELEDKSIEIIYFEEQKEKQWVKTKNNLKNLWENAEKATIHVMCVPEGEERKN